MQLILPGRSWTDTRARLLASAVESCAIYLMKRGALAKHIVVQTEIPVPDNAYTRRSPTAAELSASFLFAVTEQALQQEAGVLFVHSHPGDDAPPRFSDVDHGGEVALKAYLDAKLPRRPHASLVLSPGGCCARLLTGREIAVKTVGEDIRFLSEPGETGQADYQVIHDRQVRAFGRTGQRLIRRTKAGIVGVGGTGSVVAQELAYLGVEDFVLLDGKTLDDTNLNRVVSAEPRDVGTPKVELCARMISRVNPAAATQAVMGSVLDAECLEKLSGCEFLFVCTDNHTSRLVVNEFCYRYLIPAIDMGVAIGVEQGQVASVVGRVQMLAPGLPCLVCTNSISYDAIRRESMGAEQRAADSYFNSEGEPQPAVISLNATISSLATTMFMAAVTGLPVKARHLRYDGLKSKVYETTAGAHPTCVVCSSSGAFGAGREGSSW